MHRKLVGGLVLALASLIAAPSVAMAATATQATPAVAAVPQSSALTVPIVGNDGTNAVATITQVRVVDGVLTAVGTITGDVTTAVGTMTVTDAPFTAPITSLQAGAACDILALDLGPIHLDLLGLIVDLNEVNLDITAQPGPGNLLGNLLCAVTGLLDNTNASPNAVQQLVTLLNRILGAL